MSQLLHDMQKFQIYSYRQCCTLIQTQGSRRIEWDQSDDSGKATLAV